MAVWQWLLTLAEEMGSSELLPGSLGSVVTGETCFLSSSTWMSEDELWLGVEGGGKGRRPRRMPKVIKGLRFLLSA